MTINENGRLSIWNAFESIKLYLKINAFTCAAVIEETKWL